MIMESDRTPLLLLVDDDQTILHALEAVLGDYFQLIIAANGARALELAQRQSPDLILLDIMMPKMDGFEVCRQLKSDPETENIPIIFLTGLAEPRERVKGLQLGAVDYILKPFSKSEVLLRVRIHLKLMAQKRQLEQEITDRRKAVEDLRKREEILRAVVKNAPAVLFLIDRNGIFRLSEGSALSLLGFKPGEVVGSSAFELYQDYPEIIGCIKKALQGEFCQSETQIQGAGFDVYYSPCFTPQGDVEHIIGLAIDVTARKKIEAEKKAFEDHFYQVQKMEAIGTLTGGIAHDFNNLLMSILGSVSIGLNRLPEGDPLIPILKSIEEGAERGANLTNQLLAFASKGNYDVKPLILNDIVTKATDIFGRTRKEISIHQNFQSDLWPVEANQTRIEQVLLNLMVNAWQAMEEGGRIYVKTENVALKEKTEELAPGRYVQFTIEDTGPGMPPEVCARVFDPFFTTKGRGRGTGLGLASAYGIIKSHGGHIRVQSQPGQGAVFQFLLPASASQLPRPKPAAPPEPLRRGAETIMIVDDEELVLKTGRGMLKELGYTVITAVGGKEAVATYQAKGSEIALVILDIVMPEMDGSQVFEALKAMDPGVKVLLASGYSLLGQAEKIMAQGALGFIQKPFNLHKIARQVRQIIDA